MTLTLRTSVLASTAALGIGFLLGSQQGRTVDVPAFKLPPAAQPAPQMPDAGPILRLPSGARCDLLALKAGKTPDEACDP